MNKTRKIAALLLALIMVFALAACGEPAAEETPDATEPAVTETAPAETDAAETEPAETAAAEDDIWADAAYTADTELGEGEKTITVAVTAEDKTVVFTIHTDAEFLRGALEENSLIAGEESEYGLYVKTVDGMTADYDADGYYWSLYIGEEYATTGVDSTPIADGGEFALVREAA